MSWLSEIENEATLALEGDEAFTEGYMDDLRMARVIRELSKRIRKAKVICDDTPERSEPQILDNAITEIMAILENDLSPDAKEVIDDCTTPRST